MSVTTTSTRAEYTGNGSTTAFAFSNYANASTDIKVYLDGVEQSNGFTITGDGSSWTVTFTTAPASSVDVLLKRETNNTQSTDYQNNDAFDEDTIEHDLDKRTAVSQEVDSEVDWCLKFNPNKTVPSDVEMNLADFKGKALGFNLLTGAPEPLSPSSVAASDAASIAYNQGGTGAKDTTVRAKLQESVSVKDFGATGDGSTDDAAAIQAAIDAISSSGGGKVRVPFSTYAIASRIVPKDNVSLVCESRKRATFDFSGTLGTSSGEAYCFYNSGVSNFSIEGIRVLADVSSFTNNGFDTYGFRLDSSNGCTVKRCLFENQEHGAHFRDGCSDCTFEDVEAKNCYHHGVASFGTISAPNYRITARNILAYGTGSTEASAPISGFYTFETYDSDISNIKTRECRVGTRLERLGDSNARGIVSHECWGNGVECYNDSSRNSISGIITYDNNRANNDAIDSVASRGNDNTKHCGLQLEISFNNVISNVISFQTPAEIVPFNSGSDEPVLGSKIQGTTSSATGRIQRIELTSGSWGGSDAAGNFHLVETSGTFGSSEVVQNVTTVVPFNSGSVKPSAGDTIVGDTSGASGTVLWASLQSAADWTAGTGTGNIYLIDVTGTFNASEDLNNTTSGTDNIATTNGSATAVDVDIATTNGSPTASEGTGNGFQKYGIGINIRNLTGTDTADSYNTLSNIQAFNNSVSEYEDRGFYNQITSLNTGYKRNRKKFQ